MPDSCRCARSLLRATERIHSAPLHGEDTYGLAGWRRDAATQKRFAQESRGKSDVIFGKPMICWRKELTLLKIQLRHHQVELKQTEI